MLSKEKQIAIMRSARYTKHEAETYIANGKCTVWEKAEYEAERAAFPEDYADDDIEEVPYAENEDYVIVTNWN